VHESPRSGWAECTVAADGEPLGQRFRVCRGPAGAEATVTGEHVVEVISRGDVLSDGLAELGDLRPGDKYLIVASTDGTPGSTVDLHVRVDAPERVEVTVVEISQEDVALAELVREAQVAAAMAEQQLREGAESC
jgi:hypothetical protein